MSQPAKKSAKVTKLPPVLDPPPTVDVELTHCPRCGSTNRSKYDNRREIDHGGEHDGTPYTHVVWRNTTCEDCGQARVDRSFENRPAEPTAK